MFFRRLRGLFTLPLILRTALKVGSFMNEAKFSKQSGKSSQQLAFRMLFFYKKEASTEWFTGGAEMCYHELR